MSGSLLFLFCELDFGFINSIPLKLPSSDADSSDADSSDADSSDAKVLEVSFNFNLGSIIFIKQLCIFFTNLFKSFKSSLLILHSNILSFLNTIQLFKFFFTPFTPFPKYSDFIKQFT